jgi:hypothetical protein
MWTEGGLTGGKAGGALGADASRYSIANAIVTANVFNLCMLGRLDKFLNISIAMGITPVLVTTALRGLFFIWLEFFHERASCHCSAVIYDAEVTLGRLADESFLGRVFDDAVAAFGSVEKVERAADLQELVEAYVQALPLPK